MIVVGTAGHIDHGKTSLVRALTGIDLDRTPEEQERGITIHLGFAPLRLASGERIAFVDVPGHERLVHTMIAGATGIDAALLCVSAVDGVMPQTREHLAILDLLGVRGGVIALTMADLVDEELLELARDDVASAVRGTFLANAPVLAFSAVTGAGKEALLDALAALSPRERRATGAFRLPVDRAFVRPGFGTVVTGTVASGRLRDGAQVRLLPDDQPARVRGIHVHGEPVAEVAAGARAALNLAGIEREDVPRGTVVSTGAVPCPYVLDVRYTALGTAGPLEDGAAIRVLLGTAERGGRIHVAEDRGDLPAGRTVRAQLRLDGPLPCLPGDRFVARRPSPVETLGGGVVVDPWAPKMRRRERVAWGRQIDRLAGGDLTVWLDRAGEEGLAPQDWADRGGSPEAGVSLGDRVVGRPVVARLTGALLEALQRYHAENPLTLGANRRELRRDRLGHLSERAFDALVEQLGAQGMVRLEGPLVRLAGFQVRLDPKQRALSAALLAGVTAAGLAGLTPKELHERHPEPETASVAYLLEAGGALMQIPGVGWVARAAVDALQARLRAFFTENRELSPGAFKDMTELTRKNAIPWLEWLDRSRWTRREGEVRVRGDRL